MKKLITILFLFIAAFSNAQYGPRGDIQKVATIIDLKAYNGTAPYVFVSENSSLYTTCSPCIADEIYVFAGTRGQKWTRSFAQQISVPGVSIGRPPVSENNFFQVVGGNATIHSYTGSNAIFGNNIWFPSYEPTFINAGYAGYLEFNLGNISLISSITPGNANGYIDNLKTLLFLGKDNTVGFGGLAGNGQGIAMIDNNGSVTKAQALQVPQIDSIYKAFKNAFSGDTTIVFGTAIMRPSWGGNSPGDTLRWNLLGTGDNHDTLFINSVRSRSDGTLALYYPHVSLVLTMLITPDESLASKGLSIGASVGTDSAIIQVHGPNTGSAFYKATGTGTGWNSGLFNYSSGLTTISAIGTITGFADGYAGDVEYMGANNYFIKYVTAGVTNGEVNIELWDRITNTKVTTPPTSDDILYYKSPLKNSLINMHTFQASNMQKNIFGATSPNSYSGGNFWVIFVGKK